MEDVPSVVVVDNSSAADVDIVLVVTRPEVDWLVEVFSGIVVDVSSDAVLYIVGDVL